MAVMDSVRQEKGDVIFRQDAISVLGAQCKKEYNKTCGKDCECMEYMALRDMPSAQKKGHWVDGKRMKMDGTYYWFRQCSVCDYERNDDDSDKDTNFCPNCGADMRGDGDE